MLILKEKHILVTGGGGFLGVHVVDALRKKNCDNIFVARSKDYDLVEKENIKRLLNDSNPDIVIHLAATVGGIGFLSKHPGQTFYKNLVMGAHLLEECRKRKLEKVVLFGTVCGYPNTSPLPFKEETLWDGYPNENTAPYGMAKKMMLVMSQAYRKEYGFNSIFLLPVNLYGPKDNFDLEKSHVIPALIAKIIEAKEKDSNSITVWGDGNQTREFLYVEDTAEGIILATEKYNKSYPINLGTGIETSIYNIVMMIKDFCNYDGEIYFDKSKLSGQPRRQVNVSRAYEEFGFKSKTSLREGLEKTIKWYIQQKEKC